MTNCRGCHCDAVFVCFTGQVGSRGLRAFSGGRHGEEFMLALLTRQRDMLKSRDFLTRFGGICRLRLHFDPLFTAVSGKQPDSL
jgi:hypothetical protein